MDTELDSSSTSDNLTKTERVLVAILTLGLSELVLDFENDKESKKQK